MAKVTKTEVENLINKSTAAQLEVAVAAMRKQPTKFAPEFIHVFELAILEKKGN